MKYLNKIRKINIWLIGLLLITSCQIPKTHDKQDQAFENKDMPEAGMTFQGNKLKDLNQSDIHFSAAVRAFENSQTAEVVSQLKQGIDALIQEGSLLEGESKKRLGQDINHLEAISVEVENGSLKDIEKLQKALAAAELAVAHEYATDMNVYSIQVPLPDSYYPHFKAALNAIRGAKKHMHGHSKIEAQKLLQESDRLLDQLDEGADITEQQIRDQKAKMDQFINQQTTMKEST